MPISRLIIATTALFAVLLTACGAPPTPTATLPLENCTLAGQLAAECGVLTVPENRTADNGRTIDLAVAVIPASESQPEPDPIFLLAGGPGQSASETFPTIYSALQGLNRDRDLVLVDLRGTGESGELDCPEYADLDPDADDDAINAATLACRDRLAAITDLTQYTTEIAMADLNDVRIALGYEQINLLGISYGTRAALTYLRLYPDHTRSLVLDAVVSSSLRIYLQAPRDGERALDLFFERCAADPDCAETFPDLEPRFDALLASLATPRPVTLPDPITGEIVTFDLDRDIVMQSVFSQLYSPDILALLPLAIVAAENGDFAPLLASNSATSGTGIATGFFYSVACVEDAPALANDGGADFVEDTRFPLLGQSLLDACAVWPQGRTSPALAQPVASDVPVLLINGDADPITPPYYAEEVAESLPNSRLLVIPQAGHGVLTLGCMPTVVAAFIAAGSVADLDTACLEEITPPPFFVSPTGPRP